jgi:hypothetical protein
MRTAMHSTRIFSKGVCRFEIYLRFKVLRSVRDLRSDLRFKLLRSDLLFKLLRSDLRFKLLRDLRSDFERSERLPPACPEHGHVISILESDFIHFLDGMLQTV